MIKSICENCGLKSSATKKLSSRDLENLSNNCAEVNFKKGDIIFTQNAFSSNIIYVKKGLVKIHMSGPTHEQIIRIKKAPSYLGMPTTFGDKINQYSATALENTSVCFIDLDLFKNFISKNGGFAYEIIIEICHNELNSCIKSVNRIQKQINGRIADALLFFHNDIYGSKEFRLPLSRLELGNFVDASRESVSRILTEFHNEKIIQIKGKTITILNRKLLVTISRNG
jgi:CRP-like cAMP-binding protein